MPNIIPSTFSGPRIRISDGGSVVPVVVVVGSVVVDEEVVVGSVVVVVVGADVEVVEVVVFVEVVVVGAAATVLVGSVSEDWFVNTTMATAANTSTTAPVSTPMMRLCAGVTRSSPGSASTVR
ncbi:MAG TPA: hypothetical protein ENH00_13290 [Actinobacteria bacterium]|nr:hypothetical protein [Actinomycetota bacterium]